MRMTFATCLVAFVLVAISVGRAGAQSIDTSVAAYVGDRRILIEDLDRWWQEHDAAAFERMRRDSYDARQRALDALVAEHLLTAAADERGMTVEELLNAESVQRARAVTEADVVAFLVRNPLPVKNADTVMPLVTALLQRRAQDTAREEFLTQLRASGANGIRVLLEPPRVTVSADAHSPTRGPIDALIQLVVFSDFQCPFCQRAESSFAELADRFPQQVRFVWRHYPLSIHADARNAAEAAQCAHDQGQFWRYHDALFADQARLTTNGLIATANRLGLDSAAFASCLLEHRHAGDVDADVAAGERAGVAGTPTVFVNGIGLVGAQPIEMYERVINDELARFRLPLIAVRER